LGGGKNKHNMMCRQAAAGRHAKVRSSGLAALPLAMTAHVVFTAIDPIAPATVSATIVRDVICDSIGFQGLLMSDDISMGALSGSVGERTSAAIAAGCDLVLHCNGEMPEMLAVAAEAPLLAGAAARAEFLKLMTGAWQPARGYA
jgi:beta-N-acetylhexosaminidase